MSAIDATPILKANIIVMEKIPYQFRASWRMAVAEVNQACMTADPQQKKGAEITLALLPSMLLRAPSAAKRMISTRVKMGTRFGKFFAGDFHELVQGILDSSVRTYEELGFRIPRSHVYTEQTHEEKAIRKAEGLAAEGFILKAVRTLGTRPPAPATLETFNQLQALHPQPSELVRSAIPPGSPRNTFIPSNRAIASAVRNAPNKVKAGPTNWSYEMLKGAMSSDPTTDISAFNNIITKFCTGDFDPDTTGLFKLARMFAFVKDERGGKRILLTK